MPSLLLVVFLVQLAIHLINTIGAKTINDLLWQLNTSLPLPSSIQAQEVARLRREVVRLKREMNAVSAQDDFAKWAKIRREHDKVLAEHDNKERELCRRAKHAITQRVRQTMKLPEPDDLQSQLQVSLGGHSPRKAAAQSASRSSFDTKASLVRWLATSGLRFGLQFWYAKRPMFELPRNWFPWYVEWVLGFPRCPYGGVSINVWTTVCGVVIGLASDGVAWALASAASGTPVKAGEKGNSTGTKVEPVKAKA